MPDIYSQITEIDPQIQERLSDVLEMLASDPQQRRMWEAYLSEVEFPPAGQVLEIGCGTGTISRILASWPGVGRVLDRSARKPLPLSRRKPNAELQPGPGLDILPLPAFWAANPPRSIAKHTLWIDFENDLPFLPF